jgi:molybdopterin-guanine dinucleotide biosynthesis protein A
MSAVSQLCDVKFISMDKIKHIDSDLISFANINTLADLEFINKKVHVYEQTYGYR